MKKIKSLFLILSLPFIAIAQPEAYNWYFGDQFGLNFSSGEPVVVSESAIRTRKGSATVSDAEGNLLFYTNGGRPFNNPFGLPGQIWNRNHEVMYDMGLIFGGSSEATQSSLIIPKPGQDSVYILFTVEDSNWDEGPNTPSGYPLGRGFRYFEIDMRLNDGLGGVTVTNRRLHIPAHQALAGTLHADGERYWILTLDWTEDSFVRLLVDGSDFMFPTDVELVPTPFDPPFAPEIKISPDGKWIVCATRIMSFDNATGEIGNVTAVLPNAYSFAGTFSPGSRYYYYRNLSGFIGRVDLNAPNIPESLEALSPINEQHGIGSMRLGPFNRIYFSTNDHDDTTRIGEIRCPDTPSPIINEELFIIPPEEGRIRRVSGFPNFTDHIFMREPNKDTLPPENLTFCAGDELILESRIINPSYEYEWNTGSTNEQITISEGGVYYLNITDECGVTTYDEKNVVIVNPPSIGFGELALDELCIDETYTLNLLTDSGNDIIWSSGESTDNILLSESTTLSVTVSNDCGIASAEITAEFIDCLEDCELIFPDIISPNGDGINDTFGGFNNCAPISYELQVYNRWGKLVFESDNIANAWDGRLDGTTVPSDVYIFRAQYRFSEEEDYQVNTGQLTILR